MSHRSLLPAVALAAGLLLSGCRDAALAFGPTLPAAQAHGDQFFGSLVARYSAIDRDRRYELARRRIAENALVPSRVFDDSAAWSAMARNSRTLYVSGRYDGRAYRQHSSLAPAAFPIAPGGARHSIVLTRQSSDVYTWTTAVDFAMGPVRAADVSAVIAAMYAAPERRRERELRADVHATFPRATAMLGRYFSIDSVRTTPHADGSATTRVVLALDARRMREWYPAYGRYLERYAGGSNVGATVSDATGARWLQAAVGDARVTLAYRSRGGRLQPLTGAARPMPDTLQVTMDWVSRIRRMNVGFRGLRLQLVNARTERERTWTFIARQEPDWVLPLGAERFVRTPLRRPFLGAGSSFQVGIRDSAGAQTVATRRMQLAVEESGIVRLVARVSGHAVDDFAGQVQREQEQFARDVFAALQADVRGLGAPAAPARAPAARGDDDAP